MDDGNSEVVRLPAGETRKLLDGGQMSIQTSPKSEPETGLDLDALITSVGLSLELGDFSSESAMHGAIYRELI